MSFIIQLSWDYFDEYSDIINTTLSAIIDNDNEYYYDFISTNNSSYSIKIERQNGYDNHNNRDIFIVFKCIKYLKNIKQISIVNRIVEKHGNSNIDRNPIEIALPDEINFENIEIMNFHNTEIGRHLFINNMMSIVNKIDIDPYDMSGRYVNLIKLNLSNSVNYLKSFFISNNSSDYHISFSFDGLYNLKSLKLSNIGLSVKKLINLINTLPNLSILQKLYISSIFYNYSFIYLFIYFYR